MQQECTVVRTKILEVVVQVHDLSIQVGGTLQTLHSMLINQLKSSLQIVDSMQTEGLVRELRLNHRRRSNTTLSSISEEEEISKLEERFDLTRKPIWNPEALHTLFQMSTISTDSEEPTTDRYIEISRGMSVTTRRQNAMTQPKEVVPTQLN